MPRKQTIKDIVSQLRDPQHLDILRMLLKRYGLRLRVANLEVKDGYLYYVGTTGQIICYKRWDQYYLRTKGTLNRKAFYKRKCFEGSRKSAERFAMGNELASNIYAMVFHYRRTYPLFCFLKKRAILLIKEGKTEEEAENILRDYLVSFGLIREERRKQERRVEGEVRGMQERRSEGEGWRHDYSTAFSNCNKNLQPVMRKIAIFKAESFACEVIQDDS